METTIPQKTTKEEAEAKEEAEELKEVEEEDETTITEVHRKEATTSANTTKQATIQTYWTAHKQ